MTDKKENIRKLIEVADTFSSIRRLFESFRKNVEDEVVIEALRDFEKFVIESEAMEQVADVYDDFFTNQEVLDAVAWHESKSGQKFVKNLPALNEEISPIFDNLSQQFIKEFAAKQMTKEIVTKVQNILDESEEV